MYVPRGNQRPVPFPNLATSVALNRLAIGSSFADVIRSRSDLFDAGNVHQSRQRRPRAWDLYSTQSQKPCIIGLSQRANRKQGDRTTRLIACLCRSPRFTYTPAWTSLCTNMQPHIHIHLGQLRSNVFMYEHMRCSISYASTISCGSYWKKGAKNIRLD